MAADLNKDGRMDLAVASFTSSGTSVLIGTGAGFAPYYTLGTGNQFVGVTAGDFNGDGNLDLAFVDQNVALRVFINRGNASFVGPANYTFPPSAYYAVAADLNRDGRDELILNSSPGPTVYTGDANGQLTILTTLPGFTGACSSTLADFDGDGIVDVGQFNTTTFNFAAYLNDGGGNLRSTPNVATQSQPAALAIGDINKDGKMDYAVANSSSNTLSYGLGNGDGTFQAASVIAVGNGPRSVVAADFNADGNLDLVTGNFSSNSVSLLMGSGNSNFVNAASFGIGSGPTSLVAADLNKDGLLDLIATNSTGSTFSVLINTTLLPAASASFAAVASYATGSKANGVAAGDLNKDGNVDLAVACDANTLQIFLNPGQGVFSASQTYAAGITPAQVAIADFNGDGNADVALSLRGSRGVGVYYGAGTGIFGAASTTALTGGANLIAAADFNRDGLADVAVSIDANNLAILRSTGSSFAAPQLYPASGLLTYGSIAVADVNADSWPDVLVPQSGRNNLAVYLGSGCP